MRDTPTSTAGALFPSFDSSVDRVSVRSLGPETGLDTRIPATSLYAKRISVCTPRTLSIDEPRNEVSGLIHSTPEHVLHQAFEEFGYHVGES